MEFKDEILGKIITRASELFIQVHLYGKVSKNRVWLVSI